MVRAADMACEARARGGWRTPAKEETRPLDSRTLHGGLQGVPVQQFRVPIESSLHAGKVSSLPETSRAPAQVSTLPVENRPRVRVLSLDQKVLLSGWPKRTAYNLLHAFARCLPALVIYGGTTGLIVCATCQHRWGVLLSLTLYCFYVLHSALAMSTFAVVGLFKVYTAAGEDWHEKYCEFRAQQEREQEERWHLAHAGTDLAIDWHDVIHIVMVPNYKTPLPVLRQTMEALAEFGMSRTNLGVVLAFEGREAGSEGKADALSKEFGEEFRFILPTYHPPGLPNHLPGKSSNECWAFQELCRVLEEHFGISRHDPRVVLTVIDDDSEVHKSYFEALTYEFLAARVSERYLTTWQPPICQLKNYLRQPLLVRISSLFATLNELSCLANPIDCHVNFSSYSLSLVLASAVGGWDPEYLAEDWHMFAKCNLKTEGRVRCRPIFLPLLNYTPEEETYCGTLLSRWSQARRHALGLSELVYVISTAFLALLELPTLRRRAVFLWRLAPLMAKFAGVHFTNGMSTVWTVMAQVVIHSYMWRSWCQLSKWYGTDGACRAALTSPRGELADEQLFRNSWLVHLQQQATAVTAVVGILSGGLGVLYFHLVKERVEGDVDSHWHKRGVLVMWLALQIEVCYCGLVSSFIYGAVPLWIACLCVIKSVRFDHVVAGMLGRTSEV